MLPNSVDRKHHKHGFGVYDHVFLEEAVKRIVNMDEPTFHFVYTTTNHGPYKLEDKYLDFDAHRDLPGVGDDIFESQGW